MLVLFVTIAIAEPLTGRVTLDGQAEPLVRVEVDGPGGKQTLFTGVDGRFSTVVAPGTWTLGADIWVRDADGFSVHLRSPPTALVPGLPAALPLTEVEERSRFQPADPALLTALASVDRVPEADVTAITEVVRAWLGSNPKQRAAILRDRAALLAAADGTWVDRAFAPLVSDASEAADYRRLVAIGKAYEALGDGLGLAFVAGNGEVTASIGELLTGDADVALTDATHAEQHYSAAMAAAKRPGDASTAEIALEYAYIVHSLVSGNSGDPTTAARVREQALVIEEKHGFVRDAAASHLSIGLSYDAVHDDANAATHFRAAASRFAEVGPPAQEAAAWQQLAWVVHGDEAVTAHQKEAAAYDAAGNPVAAAVARVRAEVDRAGPEELQKQVDLLAGLPRSDAQQDALAEAQRAVGTALDGQKRCTEAIPRFESARDIDTARQNLAPLALDHESLGGCLADVGRLAEARTELLASSEAWSKVPGSEATAVMMVRQAGATWLDDPTGDRTQAWPLFEKAVGLAHDKGLVDQEAMSLMFLGLSRFRAEATMSELEANLVTLDRAVALFEQVGDAEHAAQARGAEAQTLELLATALSEAGRAEEGVTRMEQALALAEKSGDAGTVAQAHGTLSSLLADVGRFADAATHEQKWADWLATPDATAHLEGLAKTLGRPLGFDAATLRGASLGMVALYHWNAGQSSETWSALAAERTFLDSRGDTAGSAHSLWLEGFWRLAAGDRPGADKAIATLDQRARTDDDRARLWPLKLSAIAARRDAPALRQGVHDARAWLEARRSVPDALPADRREPWVAAWALVGMVEARTGAPGQGLDDLDTAVALAPPQTRPVLLGEVGRTARTLGKLQRALDAQRQVLVAWEAMAGALRPSDLASAELEVLQTQRALGDADGAAKTLARVRQLGQQVAALPSPTVGDRIVLGTIAGFDAQDLLAAGKPAEADARFQAAFDALGKYTDDRTWQWRVAALRAKKAMGREVGHDLQKLAEDAASSGGFAGLSDAAALATELGPDDQRAVLATLDTAHQSAQTRGMLQALPALDAARARLLDVLGDTGGASAAFARALDGLDVLQRSLQSDTGKVGFLDATEKAIFDADVELLVRTGHPEDALVVAERSRARAFQDLLATSEVDAVVADPSSQQAAALLDRLGALTSGGGSLDPTALVGATVSRLDPLTGETEEVPADLGTVDLASDPAEMARAVAAWKDLRAHAGDELTSLVTASPLDIGQIRGIAKRAGATLVEYHLTDRSAFAFVVPPDGPVRAVTLPIGPAAIDDRIRKARASLGVEVGRGARVGSTHASDDGSLAALREALLDPIADLLPTDPASPVVLIPHGGLFLVPFAALTDAHALSTAPAIGVLAFTEGKRQRVGTGAPLVVGNPKMPVTPWNLGPLAGAEAEARAVSTTLGSGAPLLGDRATEPAVVAAMTDARIVHLATHGITLDDDPLGSFVALAPTSEADGRLTASEVFGLHLHADLVTLSACQTGLGRISGDGVMGLGRAFLVAGTPTVLVSLWSVSDEATAYEMASFYGKVGAGMSKAEALRQAEADTRAKFPAPAEWAAFVLVGSP